MVRASIAAVMYSIMMLHNTEKTKGHGGRSPGPRLPRDYGRDPPDPGLTDSDVIL